MGSAYNTITTGQQQLYYKGGKTDWLGIDDGTRAIPAAVPSYSDFPTALGKQAELGATQRDITQQGIAADLAQFQEQRDYPYKQVQYMQSLLSGLPLATQNYNYTQPTSTQQALSGAGGLYNLYNTIFGGSSGTSGSTSTSSGTTSTKV